MAGFSSIKKIIGQVNDNKAAISAGEKAGQEAEKAFDETKVTTDVKVGNERIDDTKFGGLGAALGSYDPRKGSGMYTGTAQYMAANAAQGARMANKAYDANEATSESVGFDKALGLEGDTAGLYDRALLSGYAGPSQKTESMTESEAIKAANARGAGSTIQSYLQESFDPAQAAAKESAVNSAIAQGRTDELQKRDASRAEAKASQAVKDQDYLKMATKQYDDLNLKSFTNSVIVGRLIDKDPQRGLVMVKELNALQALMKNAKRFARGSWLHVAEQKKIAQAQADIKEKYGNIFI